VRTSPGLTMQVWMSLLSALVHLAHRGSRAELASFAAAQALFLIAGALEAGRDEAGRQSRALVPARIASIAGMAAHAAVALTAF